LLAWSALLTDASVSKLAQHNRWARRPRASPQRTAARRTLGVAGRVSSSKVGLNLRDVVVVSTDPVTKARRSCVTAVPPNRWRKSAQTMDLGVAVVVHVFHLDRAIVFESRAAERHRCVEVLWLFSPISGG